MTNTSRVNADHGRDFNPLANQTTKLRNFTKDEIRESSALPFSLQLIVGQTLTNLIVHQNVIPKLLKRVSVLQWILGRFDFCKMNLK